MLDTVDTWLTQYLVTKNIIYYFNGILPYFIY